MFYIIKYCNTHLITNKVTWQLHKLFISNKIIRRLYMEGNYCKRKISVIDIINIL